MLTSFLLAIPDPTAQLLVALGVSVFFVIAYRELKPVSLDPSSIVVLPNDQRPLSRHALVLGGRDGFSRIRLW